MPRKRPRKIKKVAPNPPVIVRLPREDRLKTIHSLAETIGLLAKALNATPSVTITNSNFVGGDPAISVAFDDA